MNTSRTIWIIISTSNIGGAELRFYGLWKFANSIHTNGYRVCLVCSPALLDALLKKEDEKGRAILNSSVNLIHCDFSGGHSSYKKSVKQFINHYVNDADILHFIDGHPLIKTKAKQVYSITQSSLKNLNLKGKLSQFIGTSYSNIIDVLDPGIFKILQNFFFFKSKNIHITANSYCDVDKFVTQPFEEKKDWFVFLGRFEHVKQVDKLIEILPDIFEKLKGRFKNDLKFIFLGYGSLSSTLNEKVKQDHFKEIPILIESSSTPQDFLINSKFFFSLQLNNNYPSRSLIEAMCCGNIPICTNVGQTRWLAKPEFSFYVPEYFSALDFEVVFEEIMSNSIEDLSQKSVLARQTVLEEHTVEKMFDYYYNIYIQLV